MLGPESCTNRGKPQVWWHIPLIPPLRIQRQANFCEFGQIWSTQQVLGQLQLSTNNSSNNKTKQQRQQQRRESKNKVKHQQQHQSRQRNNKTKQKSRENQLSYKHQVSMQEFIQCLLVLDCRYARARCLISCLDFLEMTCSNLEL